MGKPFKIDLVSDVRSFITGTRDVADSLEDVADSLDDVAKDADRAGDRLEKEFTEAFRSVRRDADRTGDQIGDDLRRGTRQAEAGLDELKDESNSTAREAAASFDGTADSIVDMFQEVAANAFAGFGPAGAVAGLAAAAGIGLALSALQTLADKIDANKEKTIELADELAEVDGNPAAIDWATRLRDVLHEITDTREWYELWQDAPKTRLEEWSTAAKRFGVNMGDAARAVTGDQAALTRVQARLNEEIANAEDAALKYSEQTGGQLSPALLATAESARKLRDDIATEAQVAADAAALNGELTDALGGLDDIAAESAQATADYRDAVAESLTEAGEAWEKYVDNGKVNLEAYNSAIEAQAKAVQQYEANVVTASSSLSAEALNYIKNLGPEAAPLLQAFVDAPLAQKGRTAANWDALGRTATDGYREGLELTDATNKAISGAQATADGRPVQIPSQLDTRNLSTQVSDAVVRLSANAPPVRLRAILGIQKVV